ncbi:MAG: hypothetical protein ABJM39_09570 [Porticoccus sp.]|uniref:hypothetical protein n=1 Tax=Porticoccus sp. TaxID=2024853 RepID=UPI00329A4831
MPDWLDEDIMKNDTAIENWNELDNAAESNLNPIDRREFFRYKEELRIDGHKWAGDAHNILTGFIWDTTESYNQDD